jgi:hypothetical protein
MNSLRTVVSLGVMEGSERLDQRGEAEAALVAAGAERLLGVRLVAGPYLSSSSSSTEGSTEAVLWALRQYCFLIAFHAVCPRYLWIPLDVSKLL